MSIYEIQPVALGGVQTYPIARRRSKVNVREFARPTGKNPSLKKFLDALPEILAGNDLRDVLAAVQRAKARKRAMLWGIGGHVIKVGLGPLLIELMRAGFVSGIAMNGAALIHDFEIALAGQTSEDVDASLGEGKFGMAQETGQGINEIAKLAQRIHIGYGEAAGQYLQSGILATEHLDASVLAAAYKLRGNGWGRRVPELGIGGDPAGGVFESCVRGAERGVAIAADYNGKFRFHPALPGAAECGEAADGGDGDGDGEEGRGNFERICDYGAPRIAAATGGGGADVRVAVRSEARKIMSLHEEKPLAPEDPKPESGSRARGMAKGRQSMRFRIHQRKWFRRICRSAGRGFISWCSCCSHSSASW